MGKTPERWGPGIPDYTEDDILKGLELHAFCIKPVAQVMRDEGYDIKGAVIDREPVQVIADNKEGNRCTAIVAGDIFPEYGRISYALKSQFRDYCLSQNVVPMFASVGIMSSDHERAEAGLALKNDGYYIRFTGLEDLTEPKIPGREDDEYQAYCIEKIIEAYSTGHFDVIYPFFSDDIQLHSQWVMQPLTGKKNLMEYYEGKGKAIRESGTHIDGFVVRISSEGRRNGNFMVLAEEGKLCALLRQKTGSTKNGVFISPKFDEDNRICEIALNSSELFDYVPYYAF